MRTIVLIIIGCLFLAVIFGFLLLYVSVNRLLREQGVSISDITKAIQNPVYKQTNQLTNVLILGRGGVDHEAPDLTDSIQIVSIPKDAAKPIRMISLPRDVWSDTLKDRINTAYYYGKTQNRPGGGVGFAKTIAEDITGIPIHYTVVIDFSAFVELITVLGGVPVQVSKGFTDPLYPIAGKEKDDCNGDPTYACRYMSVSFSEGIDNMNGERALMYVRSRHAQGDEGTDFSRGKRQQEVIEGIVVRLKTPWEWVSAESFLRLKTLLNDHITTDIQLSELMSLGFVQRQRLGSLEMEKISLEQFFYNPPVSLYQGKYVLIPKTSYADFKASLAASLSAQVSN